MKSIHTTLNNYSAVLDTTDGISITESYVSKTNSRYTSEKSLISSMALVCVVATTHSMISSDVNMGIQHSIKQASDGAQKLDDIVCKAHGNSVHVTPVSP